MTEAMLSKDLVKYHAVKMAIATGLMPEIDFIWSIQRSRGEKECFGRRMNCPEASCRWHELCRHVHNFAAIPLFQLNSPAWAAQTVPELTGNLSD
ncbi:MAG: hypothetical protein JW810_06480 [Sedimentisphaerales bacterium]|nr:hypothetical protein [Sedimentisphaerales bacterium]